MYFNYGEKELTYLKNKDKKLKEVIEKYGKIYRKVDDDLFSSIIHHIIGQQISMKAQETIWNRIKDDLKTIDVITLSKIDIDKLQSYGITYKKAYYINDFVTKINKGMFDLSEVNKKDDDEAIKYLTSLKGIGVWTAEMILLFCLQRLNILSYDDLAIKKGMCIIYNHKKIDRKLFNKYKKRLSPYGSVASLYFWAVSNNGMI